MNLREDFFPVDRDRVIRIDADTNLVATDVGYANGGDDLFSSMDDDSLVLFSGQNEHGNSSVKEKKVPVFPHAGRQASVFSGTTQRQ
jgi:hypothetical protein